MSIAAATIRLMLRPGGKPAAFPLQPLDTTAPEARSPMQSTERDSSSVVVFLSSSSHKLGTQRERGVDLLQMERRRGPSMENRSIPARACGPLLETLVVQAGPYCGRAITTPPEVTLGCRAPAEAGGALARQALANHLRQGFGGQEAGGYFSRSNAVTNRGSMSTGTDVSLSSTAFVGGRSTPSVSIIALALA